MVALKRELRLAELQDISKKYILSYYVDIFPLWSFSSDHGSKADFSNERLLAGPGGTEFYSNSCTATHMDVHALIQPGVGCNYKNSDRYGGLVEVIAAILGA